MSPPPVPLSPLFREHAPLATASAELEAALRELLERGRRRWPALAVNAAAFMRHLAQRVPEDAPAAAALLGLVAEDLYLTCACLHGVPGAVAAFEQGVLVHVPGHVAHLDPSPAFADEVRQMLRERFFAPAAGERAKVADYSGRGPLLRWVRVAALRTALTLLRQRGRQQLRDEEFGAEVLGEAQLDPELRHLRARYTESFLSCLRAAVAGLKGEQRALLRLYWVGGQSTEKIAAIYRVNRSTAVRRLAATREAIFDETRRLLCERLGLSAAEFQSLARDLQSQLDLSLASLLRETGQ